MKAIGYFRERDGDSLTEQSRLFLEFCRSNGYEAAASFLDSNRNGGDLSGFRQMVEFVDQQGDRGFLLIVVSDMASLGVELTEAARRYFQLISLGVTVVSQANGDDAGAPLLERWTQRRANGRLGDRVKAAMRRKAIQGEALGRPPYGYRVGAKRRLVVIPEEGSIVRYIFRLYLKDDLGIRRIARRLNGDGLNTRRGGSWSMVTVRDILRNRAYVGTYSRFGVRVPASHAPLISQDDFRNVQERLDQRHPATGTRQVLPFLLSGLAYCGYCDSKMIGVTRKQSWQRRDGTVKKAQYRYYQCESRANRSLCDYHTRRAEKLEGEVCEALLNGEALSANSQSANGASALAEREDRIKLLQGRMRGLDKRLERYLDFALDGRMSGERLRSLSVVLGTQQLELEERLAESQRLVQREMTEAERKRRRHDLLIRLGDDWSRVPFPRQQELLRVLLDRVVVRDDGIEMLVRS